MPAKTSSPACRSRAPRQGDASEDRTGTALFRKNGVLRRSALQEPFGLRRPRNRSVPCGRLVSFLACGMVQIASEITVR